MGRVVLALCLAVAFSGCGDRAGCDGAAGPPATSSVPAAALPPTAPPADLAAHVALAPIDQTWPALTAVLGDAAGLPRSAPGFVVSELGLPITAAEVLSTDAPIPMAVIAQDRGGIEVAAALHLRAADRLVVLATAGEGARLRAEPSGPLTRLVPLRPGDRLPLAAAVVGNHLVVATSEDALAACAVFLARSAPPALPEGALAAATLGPAAPSAARALLASAGPLLPALPGSSREALPAAIEPLLDALRGGSARLGPVPMGVAPGPGSPPALELVVEAPPSLRATGVALAAPSGPAAPWLALPRRSSVAALVHTSAPERAAEASRAATALADALGLVATRRARFGAGLQELARARGAAVAVALGVTPEGPAAWFRAALDDGEAAEDALGAIAAAAGKPAKGAKGTTLSGKATVVERVGDAIRLKVRSDAIAGGAAVDVLVRREGDALLGAASTDAASALDELRRAARGEGALSGWPVARRAAEASPSHAALLFVDLGAPAPGAPAPRVAGGASRPGTAGDGTALALSLATAPTLRLTLVAGPRALPAARAKLRAPAPRRLGTRTPRSWPRSPWSCRAPRATRGCAESPATALRPPRRRPAGSTRPSRRPRRGRTGADRRPRPPTPRGATPTTTSLTRAPAPARRRCSTPRATRSRR